ncbi:MAG: 3'-5' exonuclease [Spirochaetales bacterium]|uniref:3'-5' exonuclease n=1 Tax=Candidatus Thalassospirochaeta sargassi TaxID=3119039 RepID=A0AAJ1IHS8_9SPIO|nr:3'-5' exonuclease [Spirochaetales bacterium]
MLNRPLSSIQFTVFDFETTGLYPDKDRIIEIGAVKFSLGGDEFRFSGLINPERPIPEGASAVNHIYDKDVEDKPVTADIMPAFTEFIDDSVLVAHNIGFDASFLVQTNERLGIETPDLICLDTIPLAKRYFKGLYSYSLENIANTIGIDIENAHRAEDDAVACKELFMRCLEKIPDYTYLELKGLLKHSGIRKKSLIQNYRAGR